MERANIHKIFNYTHEIFHNIKPQKKNLLGIKDW